MEGCAQIPKHGNYYAKHDPDSLVQLAERSMNSIRDEVFATHKGVVQLSGFVDTSDQKSAAGKDASAVPNVTDGMNDLIVK